MDTDYDAILIGAGHNALAAALHLSAKGWRVGVFERAEMPGGAVKTGAYTTPGFRHDWGAMNLSLFAGSPFFAAYGAELQGHGCAFAPVTDCFASVYPDGTWLGVSTDLDATCARIAAVSAEDAATWRRLAEAFPDEAPHLFGLLGSPMSARALASYGWKTLRAKGRGGTLDFARFLMSSPRAWLTDTFQSDKVRAMLGIWGMHLDFAPDVAGGAMFPYLEGMANQSFGMVLGQGGADTVVRSLVAAIEARGGAVHCGCDVMRIEVAGGRATGIVLSDGRLVGAKRAVIAGVAPGALHRMTGGTDDARFDAAMTGWTHAPGTMMIHLAMDGLPDWTAGDDLKRFAYVHVAPTLQGMAETYAQAADGMLPAAPGLVVGQPTAVDPSRAPEGKHVLWIQVRMAPGTIRGDAAGEIAATDWAEAAEPFADRALDLLDTYAPGTRGKIVGRRIVSPAALEAENPNLVGGDQVCGSHHLRQHFLYRPARGHADGSTPIRDLHLTGAAVWPGGGTGAAPGYLLGRKLAGH